MKYLINWNRLLLICLRWSSTFLHYTSEKTFKCYTSTHTSKIKLNYYSTITPAVTLRFTDEFSLHVFPRSLFPINTTFFYHFVTFNVRNVEKLQVPKVTMARNRFVVTHFTSHTHDLQTRSVSPSSIVFKDWSPSTSSQVMPSTQNGAKLPTLTLRQKHWQTTGYFNSYLACNLHRSFQKCKLRLKRQGTAHVAMIHTTLNFPMMRRVTPHPNFEPKRAWWKQQTWFSSLLRFEVLHETPLGENRHKRATKQ